MGVAGEFIIISLLWNLNFILSERNENISWCIEIQISLSRLVFMSLYRTFLPLDRTHYYFIFHSRMHNVILLAVITATTTREWNWGQNFNFDVTFIFTLQLIIHFCRKSRSLQREIYPQYDSASDLGSAAGYPQNNKTLSDKFHIYLIKFE